MPNYVLKADPERKQGFYRVELSTTGLPGGEHTGVWRIAFWDHKEKKFLMCEERILVEEWQFADVEKRMIDPYPK